MLPAMRNYVGNTLCPTDTPFQYPALNKPCTANQNELTGQNGFGILAEVGPGIVVAATKAVMQKGRINSRHKTPTACIISGFTVL